MSKIKKFSIANLKQIQETMAEYSKSTFQKFELIAVFITGIGKFIFMDWLNLRLPFVSIVILFWSAYVIYRYKQDKSILKTWGFRLDNFRQVTLLVIPFAICSVILCFATGYFLKTIHLSWHILPLLITCPIWGSIQQFLMIALVAGNLRDLYGYKLSKLLVLFVTATLFTAVHYPDFFLMGATFILSAFYSIIYLKERNIYVLGIAHGFLGAIFFYTVTYRDPFIETFGKYLYVS